MMNEQYIIKKTAPLLAYINCPQDYEIIYAVVVYVFYKRGEKKRRIKVIHDNTGFTNAALIVSLGINSIVVDVKTYIQNNPELKDVIKEENVFEVPFKKDIAHDDSSQSEIDSILNDVREKGRQMKEQGKEILSKYL